MQLANTLCSLLTRRVVLQSPSSSTTLAATNPPHLAAWAHGVSNRLPTRLQATYSSGAGSNDAIPPSKLPSGAISSEASAVDDDAIDAMPEESFPAGARRTPGPDETISTGAMRKSPDFPTPDQATDEGRTAAADPYSPNDASSVVSHPDEPQPEPLYPSSDTPPTSGEEPAHPPLDRKDPGGTHLS